MNTIHSPEGPNWFPASAQPRRVYFPKCWPMSGHQLVVYDLSFFERLETKRPTALCGFVLAEAERLERSQPFGLAALAEPSCTIEARFQLGPRARIRTGSYVTVFETVALPFRYAGLIWWARRDSNSQSGFPFWFLRPALCHFATRP